LDIGCGNRKKKGYIGIDNNQYCKPDVFCDLNRFPYPFKDNSIDDVFSNQVIEHLDNPIEFIKELHRICKNGAIIEINCPHFSNAWTNFTHKRAFDLNFINLFHKNNAERYAELDFKILNKELRWENWEEPNQRLAKKLLSKIISFFANLLPSFCERVWCGWVGGFSCVHIKYKVIK